MALLKRKTVIGAAIEDNYGIAQEVTGSNAILVFDVALTPGIDVLERNAQTDSLGNIAPQMGARTASVTFSADVYGSGTAGSVPAIDVLLRACGLQPTTEASHSVMYQARDSSFESATIVVWQDGLKNVLTGCRGRCSFAFEMGQRGRAEFTFEAKNFTYVDEAMPTVSYSSTVPPVCLNQNFSVGGYSAVIPSLRIDLNNELTRAPSVNETGGYARVDITDRKVDGSFSPEATLIATHDWYTTWSGGVKSDITIQLGVTAGNLIKLTAQNCIYTGFGFEDRSGILAQSMTFRCAELVNVISGICDTATGASTIKDTSLFTVNDQYNGGRLTIAAGTYVNKARLITDIDSVAGVAYLESSLGGAPSPGDTFNISKKEFQILFK